MCEPAKSKCGVLCAGTGEGHPCVPWWGVGGGGPRGGLLGYLMLRSISQRRVFAHELADIPFMGGNSMYRMASDSPNVCNTTDECETEQIDWS